MAPLTLKIRPLLVSAVVKRKRKTKVVVVIFILKDQQCSRRFANNFSLHKFSKNYFKFRRT